MSDTIKKHPHAKNSHEHEKSKEYSDHELDSILDEDKEKSTDVTVKHKDADKDKKQDAEDSLPLLGGGGLLKILENVIPMLSGMVDGGSAPQSPFDVLSDNDFDGNDPAVEEFKNHGGCKGVVRIIKMGPEAVEKLASMTEHLRAVRQANRHSNLRLAFSAIVAARTGKQGGHNQYKAVNLLNRLANDSNSTEEYVVLKKASQSVLEGTVESLDAAGFRVRGVFASQVQSKNLRVAYTSLSTDDGEGYLLCPKARHAVGHAVPMPLSKCRDNCIDSRTSMDGKVSCAYKDWLKTAADNQDAIFGTNGRDGRLEVHRNPDNEANLLTLAANERSKKPTNNERSIEQRLTDAVGRKESKNTDQSTEARLDNASQAALGHHKDKDTEDRQRPQSKNEGPDAKYEGANEDANELSSKVTYEGASAKDNRTRSANSDVKKITPNTDKNLGQQVDKGHKQTPDDVMEKIIADKRSPLSDKELDQLLDEWLAKERDEK